MRLNLTIDARQVKYDLGEISGEGLENLIKSIGNEGLEIVEVSGESKSYTFLRQIALLVNVLVATNQITIDLKSSSYTLKGGLLVPIYEQ